MDTLTLVAQHGGITAAFRINVKQILVQHQSLLITQIKLVKQIVANLPIGDINVKFQIIGLMHHLNQKLGTVVQIPALLIQTQQFIPLDLLLLHILKIL
jgi:hypothetical protein